MKKLVVMTLVVVSVAVSGMWVYNLMPTLVSIAWAQDGGGSSG